MTNRDRYLELSVLIAASVVLWWRCLASDLQLALSGDAYTYILLILPLGLALMYIGTKESPTASETKRTWGLIPMGAALLLRLLTAWNIWHLSPSDNLSLSMVALVIFWIGSAIVCFGLHTFKTLLFPLCFLFLIVPLPDHALSWVREFLQQQSAWTASTLFRAVGVPVTRDGVMLSIPGLDIEVAQECSSIRSSTMLMVTTLVLAQLFLRSWWRKSLLVAAAIPLSVLKNAVRIFTIAELGTRVDRGFLDGRLHHNGGIVFLGVAVIVVVVMLWRLRRNELQKPPRALRLEESKRQH